ncbi:MAG: 30S ribosomal protein S20 [Opitutae bacterium]|nr:30S ribosomal protein S20 [Opitutae bacterium]MBT5692875.1 30S ribosomal protein S20 [Opitutae bacterium]MBT7852387.1 30S ribosomal protein S20 [Opitutae bacterium]
MANTKSAKKEARKTVKRTLHNKGIKTRLKSLTKNARAALESDDASTAQKAVSEAVSAYDKAAKRNVVHKNKARRIKSGFSGALAAKF